MCSFVRVGSPAVLQASPDPSTALPLAPGAPGVRAPRAGLTPERERKDDLADRRLLWGERSPAGLGPGERPCRGRMAAPEAQSSRSRGLDPGLDSQILSRTLLQRGRSGLDRGPAFQGANPLGVFPGTGSPNGCPCRRTAQPLLSPVCASPRAAGRMREAMASGAPVEALREEQPAVGLEPRKELEKQPACIVVNPCTDLPATGVDLGLQQTQDPAPAAEPRVGLVIEPPHGPVAQQPAEEKEPRGTEPGVEPPGCIRPIYFGNFFDRTPCWPSAGKVKPVGYRVATCLTEKLPRPVTPPEAKKYFSFRYPPPGAERVFYGRANDPQIAACLTHGIRSKVSPRASTLVNPQPITTFQQKIKDKKESIYFSHQRAPLGKSHDQTPGLPKGLDVINTTFGTPVIREISAREIVNPPKSFEDVFKEGKEGHNLYIVSHHDYFAGEAKNRKYNPASFHRFDLYGVPTSHFNDGRTMAKSLHWLHELQMKKGAKVVSKRVDDFKEKFQPKLGRVLDPIADTMTVPPDCTFGACLQPEEYGVGDLIHNRPSGECLRGTDRQRALIAAARYHLKKFNHQHFDTLLEAFRHYDKKGDGMIDRAELQEACDQANLHLDETLLDQLLDYCDVDQDGVLNFLEFANFLNWKDKVPLKEYEKRVVIRGQKPSCANVTEANVRDVEPALLIKPEDIVPKEPGSSEETVRTLLRPSDRVSKHYTTTSSEISAVVGAVPSLCYPIYGVPTVRSDIPAPRIRRISDVTNYGEEGNAYSLLHPSIFSRKGVFERDFFRTRSKDEISEILTNIGVKLSEEEFENVWNLASKKHHRGEVSVETIRNVLDELQHADRIK